MVNGPITPFGTVVVNAAYDYQHFQKASSGVHGDADVSVHRIEVKDLVFSDSKLSKRKRSTYNEPDLHILACTNGVPKDRLKPDTYNFIGISNTHLDSMGTRNASVTVAGLTTIKNTGTARIEPGDKVVWCLADPDARGPNKRRKVFRTFPFRDQFKGEATSFFEEVKMALNPANPDHIDGDAKACAEILGEAGIDAKDFEKMKTFLQAYSIALSKVNSRVVGTALTKADEGDEFDILCREMGLHPDVKKYLRVRFPTAVNEVVPPVKCEVQIVDLMWVLFKFHPNDFSSGEDLVSFFWRPIERFFAAGGLVYVCVFDAPGLVPIAKAEEHKRRYGGVAPDPLESDVCDDESLPRPWHAALANPKTRAVMCRYITAGLARKFSETSQTLPGCSVYISGTSNEVRRVDAAGTAVATEHAAAALIGEGDLAVAYWAQQFHARSTVVRVLDSDEIPILQLRAHIAKRSSPLFIWLVTPKRDESMTYHGYDAMPFEGFTCVDVLKLNAEVRRAGLRVEEFCFQIICQKTDFVDKVITNLGVAPSLTALEKNASHGISVTASAASCDSVLVRKSFSKAVLSAKRKRAEIRDDSGHDSETEFRRAWWTLCYWAFAWSGALPATLQPRPAYGFDATGARTSAGRGQPYPTLSVTLGE